MSTDGLAQILRIPRKGGGPGDVVNRRSEEGTFPMLRSEEEWYPLYVLQASRSAKNLPRHGFERPVRSKEQFANMSTLSRKEEFRAMGITFISSKITTNELLPEGSKVATQHSAYTIPSIDLSAITLEELLCHIRIVFKKIQRLTQQRKECVRQLANLYKYKKKKKKKEDELSIERMAQHLYRIRSALSRPSMFPLTFLQSLHPIGLLYSMIRNISQQP